MTPANIVQKLWNYCNVLRDDGMSYGDYVEQLTYLLFLKMADERTQAPYNQPSIVPQAYGWPGLIKKDGDELFDHYRHALDALGKEKGLLGLIFNKAQNKFQDPAKLRRLLVDLIDKENWSVMSADVKGDAYEGLLEKNAQDTKSGAGQYFTPRALIKAMVDVMAPEPGETVADPACGTGGFLLAAHQYLVDHYPNMTKPQKKALKNETFKGWELVQSTARLCAMNLLLHGIGDQEYEPVVVADALAADPVERFDVVLANPPFGKKTAPPSWERKARSARSATSSSVTTSGRPPPTSSSTSSSTSRPCSRSTAAPPWWCPTTCCSRAAPARPSAASSCTNATSTPCSACPPACSTPRA